MASRVKTGPKVVLVLLIVAATVFGIRHFVMQNGGAKKVASEVAAATGTTVPASSDPIGTKTNPLKVSIVSFHGYAPALLANGKSLKTLEGSIYDTLGVHVEFVIEDAVPTLATIFGSGTAQCAWRTSDFWAQEQPNLRTAGYDAKGVVIVDNTQGGDAIIARDPSIQKIEDLAGKKVAFLQFTPSHGLLIDAIENSSLSARKRQSIEFTYVNADEGTAGVRAAFQAGHVDAAVLWDPDLSLATKSVPGAHVIYSTKTATNLIYDLIVCDTRVLDNPANESAIQAFVEGWLKGVEDAKKNPNEALAALTSTEEFFTLLEKEQGREFVKGLFGNLVWTGLDDNARILGLTGGTNHYARVYQRFDEVYRRAGALSNPNSPVIPPAQSFDTKYVQALLTKNPTAVAASKKEQFEFTDSGRKAASSATPAITKPVLVTFQTGSATLTPEARSTIDEEMAPLIENNGAAYFQISGNTDSTGSATTNQKLSEARAQAVVKYLVDQWEFPDSRFITVGNGSKSPLCNEKKPEEGMSVDDCRAVNRTTRLAVLAR